MRTKIWAMLMVVGLMAAVVTEVSHGQSSPLVPLGRPYTVAGGFAQPVNNVPIDTSSSVVPMPGQKVGITLPNFRSLMRFPNLNMTPGTSPFPTTASYGNTYPNALNPFKQVTTK